MSIIKLANDYGMFQQQQSQQSQQPPQPQQETPQPSIKPLGKEILIPLLQAVCADLFVEYTNYKNRHWHVEGPTFKDVHEFFDEATDQILEYIDDIGEYIVSFGALAPTDIKEILTLSQIPVTPLGERDPQVLLQSGLEATQYLKQDFTHISQTADQSGELGVTNLVQDIITHLDKLIYKYQAYIAAF
jgi:starvation-inducible DNA-binding protein